jgi:GT2 family glycosyltransferase
MCKKIDIIVVNWNSGSITLKAVTPYINYTSSCICCNVIVVDNASTDDSLILFKNRIRNVIVNNENLGFGKACNQAFSISEADYILLLNPDTISQPVVLEELVSFLEKNHNYGSTGPAQVDKHGNVLRTCGRFTTFRTGFIVVLGL